MVFYDFDILIISEHFSKHFVVKKKSVISLRLTEDSENINFVIY